MFSNTAKPKARGHAEDDGIHLVVNVPDSIKQQHQILEGFLGDGGLEKSQGERPGIRPVLQGGVSNGVKQVSEHKERHHDAPAQENGNSHLLALGGIGMMPHQIAKHGHRWDYGHDFKDYKFEGVHGYGLSYCCRS